MRVGKTPWSAQQWALFDNVPNWPIKSLERMALCADAITYSVTPGLLTVLCVGEYAVSKWMMRKSTPENTELARFPSVEQYKGGLQATHSALNLTIFKTTENINAKLIMHISRSLSGIKLSRVD